MDNGKVSRSESELLNSMAKKGISDYWSFTQDLKHKGDTPAYNYMS